jgi:hypothetical protein
MLNIFVGFEQANKYAITNENGDSVGFIAEEDQGILSMFRRQMFRTHRPFRAVVMDRGGNPLLLVRQLRTCLAFRFDEWLYSCKDRSRG